VPWRTAYRRIRDRANQFTRKWSSKDRYELRRKLCRAEDAAHLEYWVTSATAQLDEDLDTFMALHRLSQQEAKQGFLTPEKEAFLRDVAHQYWPRGWLDLAFLAADSVCGRPSHGALPLLTSCVALSPTSIGLVPPISRSTNCGPVPPVRCRERVYERRLEAQPGMAPGRDGEGA
jgi:hypothetical protein